MEVWTKRNKLLGFDFDDGEAGFGMIDKQQARETNSHLKILAQTAISFIRKGFSGVNFRSLATMTQI